MTNERPVGRLGSQPPPPMEIRETLQYAYEAAAAERWLEAGIDERTDGFETCQALKGLGMDESGTLGALGRRANARRSDPAAGSNRTTGPDSRSDPTGKRSVSSSTTTSWRPGTCGLYRERTARCGQPQSTSTCTSTAAARSWRHHCGVSGATSMPRRPPRRAWRCRRTTPSTLRPAGSAKQPPSSTARHAGNGGLHIGQPLRTRGRVRNSRPNPTSSF